MGSEITDKMTYDEFEEEYGEVEVSFSSYYKYQFTWTNDDGLVVGYGGSADDIYRYNVLAGPMKIKDIQPSWAQLNGELLFEERWGW